MFSTNYDAIAASIKEFCQSSPFYIKNPRYLNCIDEIIKIFLELRNEEFLYSMNLKDKVALFNQSLEKYQVQITSEEVKIWRTNIKPSLIEATKFLEIKNLIDETFPEDSPGCNFVIMKDDTLLATHSRGYANMSREESMNIAQRQHFGSISKHFTAACVIHLAKNTNQLSLTDDIRKHFPELPLFYFKGHEVVITIDQLLTMRSGLPNMQALVFLAGLEDQDASSKQKLYLLTSQERIDLSASPGSEFNYCNTNYDILAKIIENVLNQNNLLQKNLREYANAQFFQPFEMTQTSFIDPDVDIYCQTIPGYAIKPEGKLSEITTKNKTWGPCGIIGTPIDMVKWNGKCPQEILDELSKLPVLPEPDSFSYGRGLNVGYFDNGRYKILAHSGGIEGFMTRYLKVIDMSDNEESFGIFISSNIEKLTPPEFDSFTSSLVNMWIGKNIIPISSLPSHEPEPLVLRSSLDFEKARLIIGQYAVPGWEHKACIEVKPIGEHSQGIRFMPNSENPEKYFDFFLSSNGSAEAMVFNSIDPPTATLHFNKKGFIFSDFSQSIVGLQFYRVL